MTLSPEAEELLKHKSGEYVNSMTTKGINYNLLNTDIILILEAINDWSGQKLSEGGDINLTYACDDPCCATEIERNELINRMHSDPVVFYPVSGFSLSDKSNLRFDFRSSTFRMRPHISGSCAEGIAIAESKHIQDVDAAMRLWAFCATEDCMAYLYYQMDAHGLFLEEEERDATRQIVTSSLQDRFSIGQVWNAMWRSVKSAAALSTRQYYNDVKAAKTIPKKIDKVLATAVNDPNFIAYDRLAETPLGAVLTLFSTRFGLADETPGAQVRTALVADAALAPQSEEEFDEGRGLVQGTMFFLRQFTPLDRIILSCFNGAVLESKEPTWDENHQIGQLSYSLPDLYAFDGLAFGNKLFALLKVPSPSEEDIAHHAAIAKKYKAETGKWTDESGWTGALSESLAQLDLTVGDADTIAGAILNPSEPEDVVRLTRSIPLPSGLWAIRVNYAHIYADYIAKFDRLSVGSFALSIPEEQLAPDGGDQEIVASVAAGNFEHLAKLISSSIPRSIASRNDADKHHVLALVAQNLLEEANPSKSSVSSSQT